MKNLIKAMLMPGKKVIASAGLVAMVAVTNVDAKNLSDEECSAKYDVNFTDEANPEKDGCVCVERTQIVQNDTIVSHYCHAKNANDKKCAEKFNNTDVYATDPVKDNCRCDSINITTDEQTGNTKYLRKDCREITQIEIEDDKASKKQADLDYYCNQNLDECVCKNNYLNIGDIVFVYYSDCRLATPEEKSFLNLMNNGYDCIDECEANDLITCMKKDACKTLANLKCAKIERPNADNKLSFEKYRNILKKAKKCQFSADKLIKENIKLQGR